MSRTQNRQGIEAALRLAGVQDTGRGPRVSDDIQLVYNLDNLNSILPPLERPQFVHTAVSAINAARRGVFELSAPADSAIQIQWFRNDNVLNESWSILGATGITNDLVTDPPGVSLGPPSRALIQTGTTTGGGGAILLGLGLDIPPNFPTLVVPPGRVFHYVALAINRLVAITIAWSETPISATSTPA